MTYFNDHIRTEAELHTIGALLCVLDEVASDYLRPEHRPMASGIINLIQVIAERVTKAQDLHTAEYRAQKGHNPAETPITAMHREITRLRGVACDDQDPEQAETAHARMMQLTGEIVDIPASDERDMLLKIMGHTVNGDHDLGDCPRGRQIWAEARALVA